MSLSKKTIFFLAILTYPFLTKAQDTIQNRWKGTVALNYGFIIAHRPSIVPLQQKHVYGVEANIKLQTDGKKEWQRIYGLPEIGIALSYWNLGNEKQLGNACSLIPFIDFPMSRAKKHSVYLKFGWGIGYIEKTYNAYDNYKNVAIGSHLNCALTLQAKYNLKINRHILLSTGPSISHFSNGSVVTPNLGLNLLTLSGAVTYNFGEPVIYNKTPITAFNKIHRYTFYIAAGVKQAYPAGGNNFFASVISGNYAIQRKYKSAFGLGGDLFYDKSIKQKLEERDVKFTSELELFRAGIHGSYEIILSDLTIIINMGVYLYSKISNEGSFYHRFGLRYKINNNLFTCVNLKSHWAKADYIEWGIGYRIEKSKLK